ncbi:unnamed protein product [Linum tenue]|uniref:GBF-interacting protein 1 N-terminal domain-containing protein n=2 Tax=Linum tenue TaxID=586396 RepID=A0AAV0LUF9_9ROSI|nr:unnamed protein product [Linum tenue]
MSGGGSARGGGPARAAIPENARKVIHDIREITGKQHGDEEIYAVLKDCAMDPNETAQKLLYLDTFHEVKRKRERKKESSNVQGRGGRGARGNYSDANGGRNAAHRKENGASHLRERVPSTGMAGTHRPNSNHSLPAAKVAAVNTNGPSSLKSENPTLRRGSNVAVDDGEKAPKTGLVDAKKLDVTSETAKLPPMSAPDQTADSMTQNEQGKSVLATKDVAKSNAPGAYSYADASKRAWGRLIAAAPNHGRHVSQAAISELTKNENADPLSLKSERVSGTPKEADKSQLSELLQPLTLSTEDTSAVIGPSSGYDSTLSLKSERVSGTPKEVDKSQLSVLLQPLTLSTEDTSVVIGPSSGYDSQLPQVSITPSKGSSFADGRAKVSSQLHPDSKTEPDVPNGHVTFPDHFKVPQAFKSGLTFGSFESSSSTGVNSGNGHTRDINSANAIELSHGTADSAMEPSSGQNLSAAVHIDLQDKCESESDQDVLKEVQPSQGNALPEADPNQERMQTPERHQSPTVQLTPNYGLGVLPPTQGVHNGQLDGQEPQARDPPRVSPFAGENVAVSPSHSPSPQGQNPAAAAASTQPILLRPPYHLGYLPYTPYFNPYMLHPMHQFLSHNGMPQQQPSPGSPYLTTAAAAAAAAATAPGVKFPHNPQFKPGTGAANSAPIALPPFYSSYGSSPIGFNPGLAVTSGTSASNEDLSASQLKENRILSTGPPSDVSAWIAQGQDLSSLQLNSLYHLSPQGQHHLTFATPQAAAAHGSFPGIYPPLQTIAASSTASPLLQQQSHAISAAAEPVGPSPTAPYQQQPQLAQMNWSSTY